MAYYVPATSSRVKSFLVDQVLKLMLIAPFWDAARSVDGQVQFSWTQVILFVSIYLTYDIASLLFFQKTPGQWVMGLQVVSQLRYMEPLTLTQVLIRVVVKQFNLFFSYAPDIFMLYRYDRRTLADLFAETRVVADTARMERSQSRWFIASLFIIYFCSFGWSEAILQMRQFQMNKEGIRIASTGGDHFEFTLDEDFSLDDFTE
jgi:uncharacterized RDD family membrane protein YckC